MCIRRTYIEVHVRRILVQPLLVHHNKCDAVEQIKCPLILWDKEIKGKLLDTDGIFTCQSKKNKEKVNCNSPT